MMRLSGPFLVLGLFFLTVAAEKFCAKDEFYDSVTQSCGKCRDICHNAELQRTEARCNQECAGYLQTLTTTKVETSTSGPDTNKTMVKTVIVTACICLLGAAVVVLAFWNRQKLLSLNCRQHRQPPLEDVQIHLNLADSNNEPELNTRQPNSPHGSFRLVPSGKNNSYHMPHRSEDETLQKSPMLNGHSQS